MEVVSRFSWKLKDSMQSIIQKSGASGKKKGEKGVCFVFNADSFSLESVISFHPQIFFLEKYKALNRLILLWLMDI